jgi:hypothetical protein
MSSPQQQKQAAVIVKPRAGNKSAQLVRSLPSARIKRKVPTAIGSVRFDANLNTGEGISMKKPHTLEDLTEVDRKKIAAWLAKAKSDKPSERPGFASLDAKLERLLALVATGAPLGQGDASIVTQPSTASSTSPQSALDRLELAIEEAVAEVRANYERLRAAGVKPTNVGHHLPTPKNPTNPMDQLQARVNRIRSETVLLFQKGCQNVGIIKKSAGEK